MMEEVGGLEMVQCTVHTPLLGPDVKYVQLADNHRTSWGRAMPSPVKVRAF